LAADFHTLPVIPVINQSMKSYLQSIFQSGQSQGERANVFAKVGDSNSFNPTFLDGLGLATFNPSDPAEVGQNTNLASIVNYFRQTSVDPQHDNSFNHTSAATYGGWTTLSLLTPGMRGVQPWMFGPAKATPLDVEIRQTRPAIALVMIGTCEVGQQDPSLFQTNLTLVARDLLSQGVIPVLSTVPEDHLVFPNLPALTAEYNQIIANVAENLNVPLWNLWVGLNPLPSQGISADLVHLGASPNGAQLLDNANIVFGMNYRNLTSVQVLAKLVAVVEQNGAPDVPPPPPTVPVGPFVAAIFPAILHRPADAGGATLFTSQLNQGVSAATVVQELWTSVEHRNTQISQFYQRIFHRSADATGAGWWLQVFGMGATEAQVQAAMMAGTEYAQAHPNDSLFIAGVYQDTLNRPTGDTETAYWLNQMHNAGLSRTNFALAVVESAEAEQPLIDGIYRSDLGRPADSGALDGGMQSLLGDQGAQLPLVQMVLTSAEFIGRL
jgi:hypothetical protein